MNSPEQSHSPETTLVELSKQWAESFDALIGNDEERVKVILNVSTLAIEDIENYIRHNREFLMPEEEKFLQISLKIKQHREQYPNLG